MRRRPQSETFKTTDSPLFPYMKMVMESNVAAHPHPAVHEMFYELCYRCWSYFTLAPGHLGPVLMSFLVPYAATTSTGRSAAYLFAKVVEKTRNLVHHCLTAVLEQLHPLLQIDLTAQQMLTCDDRVYLYEATGYIIMGSGVSVSDQAQMIDTVMRPLLEQYKAISHSYLSSQDVVTQQQCTELLDHIPTALTALCKRFTGQLLDACGCRPLFVEALGIFVSALQTMIHSDRVRHGVRVFLHQMITCMGDGLLEHTPAFLGAMFSGGLCGMEELRDTIYVVNQMIAKFKQAFLPVLDQAIFPLVQAIMAALQSEIDPQDTNAVTDLEMLRREYYDMLNKITFHKLHNVFISETNVAHTTHILETIVFGVAEVADPRTQKDCVNILESMIKVWLQTQQGFSEFAFNNIIPACLGAILKKGAIHLCLCETCTNRLL